MINQIKKTKSKPRESSGWFVANEVLWSFARIDVVLIVIVSYWQNNLSVKIKQTCTHDQKLTKTPSMLLTFQQVWQIRIRSKRTQQLNIDKNIYG